jgi:hypothetical protein
MSFAFALTAAVAAVLLWGTRFEEVPHARAAKKAKPEVSDSKSPALAGAGFRIPHGEPAGALLLSAMKQKKWPPEGDHVFCVPGERGIPIIGWNPHGCWVCATVDLGVPPNMPRTVALIGTATRANDRLWLVAILGLGRYRPIADIDG